MSGLACLDGWVVCGLQRQGVLLLVPRGWQLPPTHTGRRAAAHTPPTQAHHPSIHPSIFHVCADVSGYRGDSGAALVCCVLMSADTGGMQGYRGIQVLLSSAVC